MRNTVKQYIAKHFDIKRNDKIIVALSGGADSVCLTHILLSFGYTCELAHCNFHLRGEESNRDEQFVTEFAEKLHCKLHKIDFDTTAFAEQHKVSIEMAARDLRYNWFEKLRKENNAKYIAVAHHADDSVETFLMNLTRGAGLKGLCGVAPQNGHIIRPLLCIDRNEILEYLKQHNLTFVEDSTNKETIYTRNKFRNEIIPTLQNVNPAAKNNILQTIDYLNEANNIYQKFIAENTQNIVKQNGEYIEIDLEKIVSSIAPQSILHEILKNYGFNSAQCRNILETSEATGKQFRNENFVATTNRNKLIISKEKIIEDYYIELSDKEIDTPIHLKIEQFENNENFKLEKNTNIGQFDLDKIKFPLKLRHWQKGDSFYPIGMKGKKLVSDFFVDKKLSIPEKESTWLLTSADEIVWIVGMRPDNRYKITENTKNILKISL